MNEISIQLHCYNKCRHMEGIASAIFSCNVPRVSTYLGTYRGTQVFRIMYPKNAAPIRPVRTISEFQDRPAQQQADLQ